MTLWETLKSAMANTFRSKLRTTLTILAIFVGAFTLTLTNGAGTGISNYIDAQAMWRLDAWQALGGYRADDRSITRQGPTDADPGH